MNNQDYQKLLQYLKNLTFQEEDYEKYAIQFREYDNHIYRGDKRIMLAYETKWIILIFHDNPIQVYQNADVMYYHILKRYFWQNMMKDIKEYAKTCF